MGNLSCFCAGAMLQAALCHKSHYTIATLAHHSVCKPDIVLLYVHPGLVATEATLTSVGSNIDL